MTSREEEVRRILEQRNSTAATRAAQSMGRNLSSAWETIMEAHDATSDAQELREQGLHREFYLLALADLNRAVTAAEEGRKHIALTLINDFNVAISTVADQAGVARTTLTRWTHTESDPPA